MTSVNFEARARERARAKYGFYKHLAVYLVINLMLFVINMTTGAHTLWSIWPMIGWGVAIVMHGLRVFVFAERNVIVDRLTERELRKGGDGR